MSNLSTDPSTFWNENRGRSELTVFGKVLVGHPDATMAVMGGILKMKDRIAELEKTLKNISNHIQSEELRLDLWGLNHVHQRATKPPKETP